ncbi:hypothetical protein CBOM_08016 [Ceraceosorus bombacis]|uniref:Uncharacterized protein n=1 Tax=Ceraceosorus bombacis TaxID=401625 RepID=A0A0P1BKQ5_9BASI|nr:hypothetical protein CBOM_08016 [Ceraceosorus bombacis]
MPRRCDDPDPPALPPFKVGRGGNSPTHLSTLAWHHGKRCSTSLKKARPSDPLLLVLVSSIVSVQAKHHASSSHLISSCPPPFRTSDHSER